MENKRSISIHDCLGLAGFTRGEVEVKLGQEGSRGSICLLPVDSHINFRLHQSISRIVWFIKAYFPWVKDIVIVTPKLGKMNKFPLEQITADSPYSVRSDLLNRLPSQVLAFRGKVISEKNDCWIISNDGKYEYIELLEGAPLQNGSLVGSYAMNNLPEVLKPQISEMHRLAVSTGQENHYYYSRERYGKLGTVWSHNTPFPELGLVVLQTRLVAEMLPPSLPCPVHEY
jgi:hypothetical protein